MDCESKSLTGSMTAGTYGKIPLPIVVIGNFICPFLDMDQVFNLAQTCKYMRQLFDSSEMLDIIQRYHNNLLFGETGKWLANFQFCTDSKEIKCNLCDCYCETYSGLPARSNPDSCCINPLRVSNVQDRMVLDNVAILVNTWREIFAEATAKIETSEPFEPPFITRLPDYRPYRNPKRTKIIYPFAPCDMMETDTKPRQEELKSRLYLTRLKRFVQINKWARLQCVVTINRHSLYVGRLNLTPLLFKDYFLSKHESHMRYITSLSIKQRGELKLCMDTGDQIPAVMTRECFQGLCNALQSMKYLYSFNISSQIISGGDLVDDSHFSGGIRRRNAITPIESIDFGHLFSCLDGLPRLSVINMSQYNQSILPQNIPRLKSLMINCVGLLSLSLPFVSYKDVGILLQHIYEMKEKSTLCSFFWKNSKDDLKDIDIVIAKLAQLWASPNDKMTFCTYPQPLTNIQTRDLTMAQSRTHPKCAMYFKNFKTERADGSFEI